MEELYRNGRQKVEYDSKSIRFFKGLTITKFVIQCAPLVFFGIPAVTIVFFYPENFTFFEQIIVSFIGILFIHHGTPWTIKNYIITNETLIDLKNKQITLVNIFGKKRTISFYHKYSFNFDIKKVFLFDRFYYYIVLIHKSSHTHVNILDMSVSRGDAARLVDSIRAVRNSMVEEK